MSGQTNRCVQRRSLTHNVVTGRSTAPGPINPIVVDRIQHQFLVIQTLLTCSKTAARATLSICEKASMSQYWMQHPLRSRATRALDRESAFLENQRKPRE